MAEVMVQLIEVLGSKRGEERLTKQEAAIINGCKNQVIKGFSLGGSIAAGAVWVATRKLNNFLRVNLAGGAGFMTGMWRSSASMDSCINQILAMDGSRMQQELRKIVLEKYGDNPLRMQAFSKHFYLEEVFNDSTLEHPKSVYRQRNKYVDEQRVANDDTYGVLDANKIDVHRQQSNQDPKLKRPTTDIRQIRVNPGVDMVRYGDPLEVLFGYSLVNEDSHQPDSAASTKLQNRSQRRAQRRHRVRHRHQDTL